MKDAAIGASKLGIDRIGTCTPHIFKNIQGLMEELFQTKEPCLLLRPRAYTQKRDIQLLLQFAIFKMGHVRAIHAWRKE